MNVVVFDFDGVLADTLDEMLHVVKTVCVGMGYPCEPSPADLNALERMEFSELGRQLGIPEKRIQEFVERSFRLFSARPAPPPIFPGMVEAVLRLAQHNRLGLLTGNTFHVVERFLEENRLSAAFSVVLSAEAPGSRVDKLQRIVAQLDHNGGKAFFIGDSVSDVRAAREAGVTSIAVAWGHQSEAKLAGTGPDYMAKTPQELVALIG